MVEISYNIVFKHSCTIEIITNLELGEEFVIHIFTLFLNAFSVFAILRNANVQPFADSRVVYILMDHLHVFF